jgi:hypothetical protein
LLQDFAPAAVLLYEDQKQAIYILCCLLLLGLLPVWAQTTTFQQRVAAAMAASQATPQATLPKLAQFNLDFPGGTPADLVKAIEKATGEPLNVIIPTDDADTQLPPLKMDNVDIPHLFAALGIASRKYVAVKTGGFGSYTQTQTGYGFDTSDNPVTDSSIWYFHADNPILPPVVSTESICQFYQLQSYLNHGFTVDDITTAIQTGWKMAGITSPPQLNYHKETNLLIACGKPDELSTIQSVLNNLPGTYLDQSDWHNVWKEINGLKSQVDELEKKVSAPTAHSTENSSGK